MYGHCGHWCLPSVLCSKALQHRSHYKIWWQSLTVFYCFIFNHLSVYFIYWLVQFYNMISYKCMVTSKLAQLGFHIWKPSKNAIFIYYLNVWSLGKLLIHSGCPHMFESVNNESQLWYGKWISTFHFLPEFTSLFIFISRRIVITLKFMLQMNESVMNRRDDLIYVIFQYSTNMQMSR